MIFRKPREGGYSIEELFGTIARELTKQIEVIEYQVGSRDKVLWDVWRLRKLKADIYHVTGDVHYFVPLLPKEKTVLTVHDINHYLQDLRGLKRWLYKWLWLVWPIRAARAVTAISTQTKASIIADPGLGLGSMADRIRVIENCHSSLLKPIARQFNTACPVVLHLGTLPHKNVPRLIEALCGIQCKLVLIGPLDASLRQQLGQNGIYYVNPVDLDYEEVCEHYVNSDIVSFVSLAEGFGMPIIEAQAVGRPVVTSAVSPMRDVAGDGACLVDPLNVAQIREAILRIVADAEYRDHLVAQGLVNVVRFSPATISGKYLSLYSQLI